MIPQEAKERRFNVKTYNKEMDWAWKILGFKGKNPNRIQIAKKKKKKGKKGKKNGNYKA